MQEKQTHETPLEEAELSRLLGELYREPQQEAHFEERFLTQFHERVVQSAVCRPTRHRVWENICQFLSHMTMTKFAVSTCAVMVFFAIGLMVMENMGASSSQAIARTGGELSQLRASINDLLGADPAKAPNALAQQQPTATIPSHLDVRLAPEDAQPQTFTGCVIHRRDHRPSLTIQQGAIYVKQPGDRILNIKLIASE